MLSAIAGILNTGLESVLCTGTQPFSVHILFDMNYSISSPISLNTSGDPVVSTAQRCTRLASPECDQSNLEYPKCVSSALLTEREAFTFRRSSYCYCKIYPKLDGAHINITKIECSAVHCWRQAVQS